jgi:predicted  nucleic acid-binding Zn-ribbon protein
MKDSREERQNRASPIGDIPIIDHLDTVTIESEEETVKVMDSIEAVMADLDAMGDHVAELGSLVKAETVEENKEKIRTGIGKLESQCQVIQEKMFDIMHMLQFQDILRQKIENIAKALGDFHNYLGAFLGRGKFRGEDRRTAASSAIHITGLEADTNKEAVDDIIEEFKTTDKGNTPSQRGECV